MHDPRVEHYLADARFSLKEDNSFALISKGFDYLRTGKDHEGYEALLSVKSANPDLLNVITEVAVDLDQFKDARMITSQCLDVAPQNVGCRYNDLMLRIHENDFGSVVSQCRERLQNSTWLTIPCSLAEMGVNNPAAARQQLEKLGDITVSLSKFKRLAARGWLVDVLIYEGKLREAERIAGLISGDKSSGETYGQENADDARLQRAEIAYLRGELTTARELSEKLLGVVQGREDEQAALVLLARTGKDVKNLDSSLLNETSARLISSFKYSSVGHYGDAAGELEKAHEESPLNTQVSYELALAYKQSGQTPRAISLLNEIIKNKGHAIANSEAYYWVLAHSLLGDCLQEIGDEIGARRQYTEFLKIWKDADDDIGSLSKAKEWIEKHNPKNQQKIATKPHSSLQ